MNISYANLKAEMARKGDTQNTLAEVLGLSISQISKRMNGQIDWSISEIRILCNRYNMSFEELFKK